MINHTFSSVSNSCTSKYNKKISNNLKRIRQPSYTHSNFACKSTSPIGVVGEYVIRQCICQKNFKPRPSDLK